MGCCVFIFIRFYANFDFFYFFYDLLVIQQRVVQPPYVGIFNSFSTVMCLLFDSALNVSVLRNKVFLLKKFLLLYIYSSNK